MTEIQVKERPILFSGAMVRALLNGSKTQTRRAIKNQPEGNSVEIMHSGTSFPAYGLSDWISDRYQGYGFQTDDELWRCPYGQPGERLWVRETFNTDGDYWYYRADFNDGKPRTILESAEMPPDWKPSIFMPRAASRLLLEITAVRVERLKDISEADAMAEGIEIQYFIPYEVPEPIYKCYTCKKGDVGFGNPVASYESLWASINGPESWEANPWVWVVEFKIIGSNNE